eukprot:bmy_15239T0
MPVLSEDSGLHETLALLTSQLRPDSNQKEEMGFLRDVFSEKSLSYLMKAQSQGSITLKIIPATQEEDRLKDSKLMGLPIPLCPHRRLSYRRAMGTLLSPQSLKKPPWSLGARLHELKQKVVAENPQHFGVAVPHTTRPRKSHEEDGVEYHFVSKQAFEADLHHNKFLEHGEYKENLYGTSLEAIQVVMAKNKVCLVDVEPDALQQLRTSEFKPYVIFVKPAIQEKRKTPPMSPACEDAAAPLGQRRSGET